VGLLEGMKKLAENLGRQWREALMSFAAPAALALVTAAWPIAKFAYEELKKRRIIK